MERLTIGQLYAAFNRTSVDFKQSLLAVQDAIIAANTDEPIPFDWEKYQTGKFDVRDEDGNLVEQLARFTRGPHADVYAGVVCNEFRSYLAGDLFLHPKKPRTIKMQMWKTDAGYYACPLDDACLTPNAVKVGQPFDMIVEEE